MEVDRLNQKHQQWALVLGFVLFERKEAAYSMTNSNAILTDTLEGLVNIVGAVFSWVDIHNFKMVRNGSKIHMDAHLTLALYYIFK